MKTELEKVKAGTTLNLKFDITIHLSSDRFYSEKTMYDFLTSMIKYYFTGDISLIEDYIKSEVDIKKTIE